MLTYRQLHPENPELDDYDVMEEEIYRWLFKTIDELPPRCKKYFYCIWMERNKGTGVMFHFGDSK